jgi:hypothetical protein
VVACQFRGCARFQGNLTTERAFAASLGRKIEPFLVNTTVHRNLYRISLP